MESSQSSYSTIPHVEPSLDVQGHLKILVVRPDRLGDVILSTPVFDVIKQHYPNAHLTALVKEHVRPLLAGLPSVDKVFTFAPEGRHLGIKGFFRLCRELRDQRFRVAIVLQSHWKIAFAIFLARIRYRIGPLSKIHSYFFYNRGMRQRRSHVEMHETDYNLQLLRRLGIRVGTRSISTQVHVADEVKAEAGKWLEIKGYDPTKDLILVHPGMGGSALNWPESHYYELIKNLIQDGKQILVTGGPSEHELLDRVKVGVGAYAEKIIFYKSTGESAIDFLGALCSYANVVVAPSTGPLHLAVALGKPVVTFYPPIRVQSALRWGPYMTDESKGSILVPEIYCGEDFRCAGNLCNYFPCMKGLTVKQAFDQVKHQLTLLQNSSQMDQKQGNPNEGS